MMDVFSILIFVLVFFLCLVLLGFLFVVGTREQSFEDSLSPTGEVQKDKRKLDHLRESKRYKKSAKKISGASDNLQDAPRKQDEDVVEEVTEREADCLVEPEVEDETVTKEALQLQSTPCVDATGLSLTAAGKKKAARGVNKNTVKDAVVSEPRNVARDQTLREGMEVDNTGKVMVKEAKNPEKAPLLYTETSNLEQSSVEESSQLPNLPQNVGGKKKKGSTSLHTAGGQQQQKHLSVHDLIVSVKKTTFEDAEIQSLIDILQNKMPMDGPSTSVNGAEWVNRSSTGVEIKNLQRSLADRDERLEQESLKVKTLSDRLNSLRQELNVAKSNQVNAQRVVEDIQARNQHQVQQLQNQLQQEIDRRHRDVNHFQSQIQLHSSHSQQLQASLDQMTATAAEQQARLQQQQDPANTYVAELEQLRSLKATQEAEINSLHSQLARNQKDFSGLQQQLSQSNSRHEETLNAKVDELKKAQKETSILTDKLSRLEREAYEDQVKTNHSNEEINKLKNDMQGMNQLTTDFEVKMKNAQVRLKCQENKIQELTQDNTRLSDELACALEKRKDIESSKQNGIDHDEHTVDENKLQEVEDLWRNKLSVLSVERDKLLEEHAEVLQRLKLELSNSKNEVERLTAELKHQDDKQTKHQEEIDLQWRDKLSDISTKHDSILATKDESLKNLQTELSGSKNEVERLICELREQRDKNNGMLKKLAEIHTESNTAQKSFLKRLFPNIQVPEDIKDHSDWLDQFAVLVHKTLADKDVSHDTEPVDRLEKQVNHYKSVLGETEKMLHRLQSSVESEETNWRQKMAEKENQVYELSRKNEILIENNSVLQESVNLVKGAEEMQEKLVELQKKLIMEENERKELEHSYIRKTEDQSSENRRLADDLVKLEQLLSEERKKEELLCEQLARMNQVVSAGQNALHTEQKNVQLLTEQLNQSEQKVS